MLTYSADLADLYQKLTENGVKITVEAVFTPEFNFFPVMIYMEMKWWLRKTRNNVQIKK
jgi:hypothetical protein